MPPQTPTPDPTTPPQPTPPAPTPETSPVPGPDPAQMPVADGNVMPAPPMPDPAGSMPVQQPTAKSGSKGVVIAAVIGGVFIIGLLVVALLVA